MWRHRLRARTLRGFLQAEEAGRQAVPLRICDFGLLRVVRLVNRRQQRTDGQGDTLVLRIDVDDLCIHFLTLSQNVLGLADAAVSDLRDVDQAVHTGDDLCECTEGHELDDLDLDHIANMIVVGEDGPRVGGVGLVAEGDLLLLRIEGDDEHLDGVADLDDLSRVLDVIPAQLGNMDHAVHAADVNECAVGSQGLDNTGVVLADLDLAPDLLLSGLALLGSDGTDGTDHAAAGTVDL